MYFRYIITTFIFQYALFVSWIVYLIFPSYDSFNIVCMSFRIIVLDLGLAASTAQERSTHVVEALNCRFCPSCIELYFTVEEILFISNFQSVVKVKWPDTVYHSGYFSHRWSDLDLMPFWYSTLEMIYKFHYQRTIPMPTSRICT